MFEYNIKNKTLSEPTKILSKRLNQLHSNWILQTLGLGFAGDFEGLCKNLS